MKESLESTLIEFSKLEENWDSYGGLPIGPAAIRAAYIVSNVLKNITIFPPGVVPTSNGGISLEWHINTTAGEKDFDISFNSDGSIESIFAQSRDSTIKQEYEYNPEDKYLSIQGSVPNLV
jgi:hypothetical protein